MKRFDLVIFDCDGVLVDSEHTANQVLANILNRFGARLTAHDALNAFVGQSVDAIRIAARTSFGIDLPADWSDLYYTELLPVLAETVQPVDGVLDLVQLLQRSGQRICVASQGPPDKMQTTLGATGMLDYFPDRVFSARTVKKPKPAPDLFLHASERCGVLPGTCAVIEDSAIGVDAGIAAGMTVFAFCPEGRAEYMAQRGAIPFHSMAVLSGLLGYSAAE